MSVIQNIGSYIKDHLLQCQPGFFECGGHAIAKQVKSGKDDVKLTVLEGQEYKDVSISDSNCNYFYIRFNGKRSYKKKPDSLQTSSCVDIFEKIVPLRLVVVGKCISASTLEEWAASTLSQMDFSELQGCENPCVILTSSNDCLDEIFEEEFGVENKKWFSEDLSVAVVDFKITYDLCRKSCKAGGDPCGNNIDLSKKANC